MIYIVSPQPLSLSFWLTLLRHLDVHTIHPFLPLIERITHEGIHWSINLIDVFLIFTFSRVGLTHFLKAHRYTCTCNILVCDNYTCDMSFLQADVDGNGTIDYIEFITVTMHRNRMEREHRLYKAFLYFDKDNSG